MRKEIINGCELYCGDCLEILPTLTRVDAVITDPPYGVNTKSDGSGKLSPWGDLCNSAYWYAAWLTACRNILNDSGCLWSFLNWRSLVTFQKASCDIRWPIESLLIWDKEWIGPGGPRGLRPSYEMVALWCGEAFSIENRGLPDVQRWKWSSIKPTGHPAEKPLQGLLWLVKNSCKPSGTVLDPFMGSGTSGVACAESGQGFIGIEQDVKWFDFACRRIEAAKRQPRLFDEPEDKHVQRHRCCEFLTRRPRIKSIDNGDGATMTPLEVAQDVIKNRDDDRCALNNLYSQKLARHIVELHERYRWIPVGAANPIPAMITVELFQPSEGTCTAMWGKGWSNEEIQRILELEGWTHWRIFYQPEKE